MDSAGFILAGGRSSRMGRDKALLPLEGATLLERVAGQVRAAAGSVTIVAPAGRYEHLGLPLLEDRESGLGPLGGIVTALGASSARWNLIVACDMPLLSESLLTQLLRAAELSGADIILPRTGAGRAQPLCAVYQRGCLDTLEAALAEGTRKVVAAFGQLQVESFQVEQNQLLLNLNTPQDWDSFRHA